jgi:hemoglobin-like flavoprotein
MVSGPVTGAPEAPPLDPGVLQVIRSSVGRLAQYQQAFIQQLHSDLATLIPAPANVLWVFCERMVQSVLWVAVTDEPPSVVADTLRRVGASNRLQGFPDDQYVNVAHALVRAVRELSGYDWSASMGSAWISYFLWMRPHLLAGAGQATAQQATAGQETARQATTAPAPPPPGGPPPTTTGDTHVESVADMVDDEEDEDDEDPGYGQIMVSMTLNSRRDRPRPTGPAR